jgi:hypothetical protein
MKNSRQPYRVDRLARIAKAGKRRYRGVSSDRSKEFLFTWNVDE